MLRLTRLADYAIVVLACLARQTGHAATARSLAEQSRVPWPTVVKVLKILAAGGLVRSARGRQGGYGLVRAPQAISVADVIEAVEGPIALTECSRQDGPCAIRGTCRVEDHWPPINRALQAALTGISLAELAAAPPPADRPGTAARSEPSSTLVVEP